MQFMSPAAADMAAWVVYQADFVEGLETRPCMPIKGYAVLDGHPLAHGKTLPASSGTVEIAKQLGLRHPIASDDRSDSEIEEHGPILEYFPINSDLLCILKSGDSIRAVHLRLPRSALIDTTKNASKIVQAYYAESKIPTSTVYKETLDPIVTNNLKRVLKLGRIPDAITSQQIGHALQYMQERIFHSAPRTWIRPLLEEFGLDFEAVFRIFHYGVLRRYLKVELRDAVAMDRIHRPEKINFAADFASRYLEPMR